MLTLLCKIPENIGWVLVGVASTLLAMILIELGKIVVDSIRLRRNDNDNPPMTDDDNDEPP
jgi:hypothetical protein